MPLPRLLRPLLRLRLAGRVLMSITFTAALACSANAQKTTELPDLQVADNGRGLETVDGEPFFWLADTGWRIFRLTPSELDHYMARRAEQGFNVIQGPQLLGPVANHAGVVNDDAASPNAAWFDHIDTIIDKAAEHGLYVAPVLAWGAAAPEMTEETARQYGQYVGQRYGDRSNVAVFIVAGEFNHPGTNANIWQAVAEGLREGSKGQRLITIHPKWIGGYGGQTSSAAFHDADWLSFNMIQSAQYGDCTTNPTSSRFLGVHNWLLVVHDYRRSPVKPTLESEPTYEQINPGGPPNCQFAQARWDAPGVRRRAYWSVMAGSLGHTYGGNGVWQVHKEEDPVSDWAPIDYWQDALEYPGACQIGLMRRLMESRPHADRVPAGQIITEGQSDTVPDHIEAMCDDFGRYAMVYVPNGERAFKVNMKCIAGNAVIAWWFDPITGDARIGSAHTAQQYEDGQLSFVSPPGQDWVLVIDDASQDFPAPGSDGGRPSGLGDVTGDGSVDIADMISVIVSWGKQPKSPADLNGDGWVDRTDLLLVTLHWQS